MGQWCGLGILTSSAWAWRRSAAKQARPGLGPAISNSALIVITCATPAHKTTQGRTTLMLCRLTPKHPAPQASLGCSQGESGQKGKSLPWMSHVPLGLWPALRGLLWGVSEDGEPQGLINPNS